jgi:1,4-alpha-glucan branching enzyme
MGEELLYLFADGKFCRSHERTGAPDTPVSIYEVDLASWARVPEEGDRRLTHREIAGKLADYVHDAGFTHVALLPEPQPGTPSDFLYLVDTLHQRGAGVIVDWEARMQPEFRNLLTGDHIEGMGLGDADSVLPAEPGFRYKWNMGWTAETLAYLSQDPLYRAFHHNRLTASAEFVFPGDSVLPLSDAEVGPGKGSLIGRMPGDDWKRFANLRLLYGYMTALPGKKLLFMGDEFGQWREWNPQGSLDWHLLEQAPHRGLQRWVRDLNTVYRGQPALYEFDSGPAGFQLVDSEDNQRSILSFRRIGRDPLNQVLFIFNFTPVPRQNYRAGVPERGEWRELLNGDATLYGGSGQGNLGSIHSAPVPMHGYPDSLNLTLPPLAMIAFRKASR